MSLRPFHVAFPVDDLEAARRFYGAILGCSEGRSTNSWIDFDGHDVPVPHFGVVLAQDEWEALAERVRRAGIRFIIEPYTRFKGQAGEQSTMFFLDPAGNALEFKAFAELGQLFAR
jgi:extradiol dioxygenase family protein